MESFPFSCPVEVRFADIDAMDHVNNATTVTYLEVARTRLWRALFGLSDSAQAIPFIVARVAVDYRSPIRFGDKVEVGIGVSAVGRTSFTLRYRIEASGRLAAEAETVQVVFDWSAAAPKPIDDAMRTHLSQIALQP